MTFHRPAPRVKQMDDYTARPRADASGHGRALTDATMCVPLPKAAPWRCEAYRRLVAAMDCMHCGRSGPSQCAHIDEGKGLGIKAPDHSSMPLCADAPGRRGCHSLIGTLGMFTRDQRRTLETKYAAATRARIKADGLWKPEWPEWEEACAS